MPASKNESVIQLHACLSPFFGTLVKRHSLILGHAGTEWCMEPQNWLGSWIWGVGMRGEGGEQGEGVRGGEGRKGNG